jgi:hypothetical protein
MIMYFMVVPSSRTLTGRWPPVGAGNPIPDILHQVLYPPAVRRRQDSVSGDQHPAIDLGVDGLSPATASSRNGLDDGPRSMTREAPFDDLVRRIPRIRPQLRGSATAIGRGGGPRPALAFAGGPTGNEGAMQFGYKLSAEGFGPKELIRQAVRAEQAGFDFVEISDHYHPWLDVQGHSPFAWTVLGAIAAKTSTLGLATGVTCPSVRYHPAIVAQAAATLAIVSDNRFTLGVGAGERLNEHVVGQGFPSVRGRHERLREALEIINLLWQGGYQS